MEISSTGKINANFTGNNTVGTPPVWVEQVMVEWVETAFY